MQQWDYRSARDLHLSHRERMRSLRREIGLVQWTLHHGWWSAMRMYLRFAQRFEVRGAQHLPAAPPFVMVANHTSHLDALCLAAALPRGLRECSFPVAAGDTFFDTTARSTFAALLLNALPMWRKNCGRHALAELRERLLGEPCGLILFPEGTRSRTGELGEFKPGLGMLIAGCNVPVVPCAIRGAFEAWPPERRRPRAGRVCVEIGPALRFADAGNDRAGWERVVAQTRIAVEALLRADAGAPGSNK